MTKKPMQTMNPGTTMAIARRGPTRGSKGQVELCQIVSRLHQETPRTEKAESGAIKISVEFKLKPSEAKSVAVAGDFNGWSTKETPLKKNGDCWTTTVELPRGRYEYRFVVDGKWLSDPGAKNSAANPFGEHNSVLSL